MTRAGGRLGPCYIPSIRADPICSIYQSRHSTTSRHLRLLHLPCHSMLRRASCAVPQSTLRLPISTLAAIVKSFSRKYLYQRTSCVASPPVLSTRNNVFVRVPVASKRACTQEPSKSRTKPHRLGPIYALWDFSRYLEHASHHRRADQGSDHPSESESPRSTARDPHAPSGQSEQIQLLFRPCMRPSAARPSRCHPAWSPRYANAIIVPSIDIHLSISMLRSSCL